MKRTIINRNNKPSGNSEGIMEYRVHYSTTDGATMFKRLRADNIQDMYSKVMKEPKFKGITKLG